MRPSRPGLLLLALAALAALLLAWLPAAAQPTVTVAPPVALATPAPVFGAGPVVFQELEVPGDSAAEPTIGIPWNTDSLFYYPVAEAGVVTDPSSLALHTMRARFDANGVPTWAQVDPPYQVPINLDPMLVADSDTGRVFSGGLLGPCSSMVYSDDDGETWLPTINMCSGEDFDHQSIGLGPPAGPIPSPEGTHVGYYCGQGGTISCARSLDQGTTWGPFVEVPGSCGGFHGHIRVSPTTGFVVVPTASCGEHAGYISTADGGITWTAHEITESEEWTNGFDPSAQFSRPGGWLYYGMVSEHGIYMALSKDEGASWEPLGGGMGVAETTWLDVGQFHDPPVVSGVFTNVQAGDDERVALSFIGLEGGPGKDLEFLKSNEIYQCNDRQDELVWHYYVALSYDAGRTWSVHKLTTDPVQVGGIYDVVIGGGGGCRNLLDFQDMDIDSKGRIHIGWADGCTGACATNPDVDSEGARDAAPRLLRQIGGKGLFKEFDTPEPPADQDLDGIPDIDDADANGNGILDAEEGKPAKESPGLAPALLLVALAFLALRRRR
ncbi:MAG: sialidase family protein [Thermoplasmatota archaeon]